jgi:CDP-glucose 4,6-dehydratase
MEELGLTSDFWAGRHVLVTGHTGFKGSWLLLMLNAMGAKVTGLSLAHGTNPAMFNQIDGERLCDHRIADIRDANMVTRIVSDTQPEIIMHLAAQPLVRRSYADPVESFAINVLGTANVLNAARQAKDLKAIVSVTTDKCYENVGQVKGYVEGDRLGGHDPYSNSKACAELVSQCFRDSFFAAASIGVATARAGNVIGGGDYSADRLVPDAARAFSANRDLEIRNPDAVRPWQHVIEPLSGYLLLAERLALDPVRYAGGWNFGPPQEDMAPVSRVIDLLAAQWGRSKGYIRQPGDHPHEAAMLTLDSSKACHELGWAPRLSLEQATGWSAEWYRAVEAGVDARVLSQMQIRQYFQQGATDEAKRVAA